MATLDDRFWSPRDSECLRSIAMLPGSPVPLVGLPWYHDLHSNKNSDLKQHYIQANTISQTTEL